MKRDDASHTLPDPRGIEEALALFPLGLELTRARLRREDPSASPELIEERLAAWLHKQDKLSRPAGRNGAK